MSQQQPILVGTDLGAGADEAIRQASAWARRLGSPLVVCHVAADHLFDRLAVDEVTAALRLRVDKLIGGAEALPGAADAVRVELLAGSPHAALIQHADALRAHAIVVGASSAGAVSQAVFGTTAQQTLRYAHCPVLVARGLVTGGLMTGGLMTGGLMTGGPVTGGPVAGGPVAGGSTPEGAGEGAERGGAPGSGRAEGTGPVVVGTDFSEAALTALDAACAEARARQSALVAVHCLDEAPSPLSVLGPLVFSNPEPSEEAVSATLAAATQVLSALLERCGPAATAGATPTLPGPGAPAPASAGAPPLFGRTLVLRGAAATGLLSAAEQEHASLIVVGTSGRTGLRRIALGSVAETVARRASCSVLVVRTRRE